MLAWSLVTAEMSSWDLPSSLGRGRAVVPGQHSSKLGWEKSLCLSQGSWDVEPAFSML